MDGIGSFLELDSHFSGEYYNDEKYSIVRLNTARAGIYHAIISLGCRKVLLPYYECFTVRDFLKNKGIEISYYHIDEHLEPVLPTNELDTAIVIVNYFGIFSTERMTSVSSKYHNVIIDNAQSFYSIPIKRTISVYSPRKFFGVPDGCYVIGDHLAGTDHYEKDFSSKTAGFLFERIEFGCEEAYRSRMINEERLEHSDILKMSVLTKYLLGGIDYTTIQKKRRSNFVYAYDIFKQYNIFPYETLESARNNSSVYPYVYPLVIEDSELIKKLIAKKIFIGRWWNYLIKEVNSDSIEYFLSAYMLPIPIDHRYGKRELDIILDIIKPTK